MNDFTYDEFITGEKFQNMAEFKYLPHSEIPNKDCLIYCKTDYLELCIPKIESKQNTYVLISHNSDGNIVYENPRNFDYKFTHFPKNIKIWFAQNIKVNHNKLISIPIGLESNDNIERKKDYIFHNILHNRVFNQRNKLFYINHNIYTNIKVRQYPYLKFKTNNWLTIKDGRNGLGFLNYANDLLLHSYVLCPEGNGKDTHRIWEALYLGCVPVIKEDLFELEFIKLFNMKTYSNLDYINEEFFNCSIPNIEKYYEFLKFSYWKKIILGKIK
jgi:hypothetical protein